MSTVDPERLMDVYEVLFAQEGWKELVDDLRERCEVQKTNLINSVSTERDLYFVKGLVYGYSYIIGLESIMEQARLQKLADDHAETTLPEVYN